MNMEITGANGRKVNFWFMFDDALRKPPRRRDPCPWCEGCELETDGASIRCRGCGTIMPAEGI